MCVNVICLSLHNEDIWVESRPLIPTIKSCSLPILLPSGIPSHRIQTLQTDHTQTSLCHRTWSGCSSQYAGAERGRKRERKQERERESHCERHPLMGDHDFLTLIYLYHLIAHIRLHSLSPLIDKEMKDSSIGPQSHKTYIHKSANLCCSHHIKISKYMVDLELGPYSHSKWTLDQWIADWTSV